MSTAPQYGGLAWPDGRPDQPLATLPPAPPTPPEWSATWHPPLTYEAWVRFYGGDAGLAQVAMAQVAPVTQVPEPPGASAFGVALAVLLVLTWARRRLARSTVGGL